MDKDLQDLKLIKELIHRESSFLHTINEVYTDSKVILDNRITKVFSDYTLHDSGHSLRIIGYMGHLVPDEKKLSDLEIALLVLSAILHDIGMAVSKEQISKIKSDELTFTDLKYSSVLKLAEGNENLALQEFVRKVHARLSKIYIVNNLKTKLFVPSMKDITYEQQLGLICQSHTENYDWIKGNLKIKEVIGDQNFNSQFIASILRLADILDIDSNRTPYSLYKLINPRGFGKKEWKQHFIISNQDKIEYSEITQQKYLILYGSSNSPRIHRKLLNYITWINYELERAIILTKMMEARYFINFENAVRVNIHTEGFVFSDYKIELNFSAISNLLMGEKLYGSNHYGLRELVQNSYDACILKREIDENTKEYGDEITKPKIQIILSESNNQIIVKDNGIGMNLNVIKKHFLNIGLSYYKSRDFQLKDLNYIPIGNYGIGFLSCFMLSDQIEVITRNYLDKHKYTISTEKGEEWISLQKNEDLQFQGTEIILSYEQFKERFDLTEKTEDLEDFSDELSNYLQTYFLTDDIDIEVIDRDLKLTKTCTNSADNLKVEKGQFKIDIASYLHGFEGTILIQKNKRFYETLHDLKNELFNEAYVHTTNGLIKLENTDYLISDYCIENKIRYLEIPLIDAYTEEKYENGMEFTDEDLDEVLERLESDLNYVDVLYSKNVQEKLKSKELGNGRYIIGEYALSDLHAIGHSSGCKTKATVKELNMYQYRDTTTFMPYFSLPHYRFRIFDSQLYIRNVLIDDFRFYLRNISSIFSILIIKINIKHHDFVPNITRNDLSDGLSKQLNYLIGKVVHLAVLNEFDLTGDQRTTLEEFIKELYPGKSKYEL